MSQTTHDRSDIQRVLVTGATGAIGSVICPHLRKQGFFVRGFARRPSENVDESHQGDLDDREAVRKAVEGMDAVIHLGAYPNPEDFLKVLLGPNVIGLYHICDWSREFGVKRLILSSSVQAISGLRKAPREGPVRIADGPAATNHYGLTKVWAEEMGAMYARSYDMSVMTVRIGWYPRNPKEANMVAASKQGPAVFFSHGDACRLYERCLRSARPADGEHLRCFGISRPEGDPVIDPSEENAILGYEPQDVWPQGLTFPWPV